MPAVADPEQSTNRETFVRDMDKALPAYARPVFLRFLPEVNKTGETPKHTFTHVYTHTYVHPYPRHTQLTHTLPQTHTHTHTNTHTHTHTHTKVLDKEQLQGGHDFVWD